MKFDLNSILHGPALDQLKTIASDSIDLLVTDPPYGYSFMNKDWDKAVVGVDTWKECLRVLKAGAFAFIMSSPRQDVLCKMILNLIEAGFETNFTSLYWCYASGFPKAADVSKLVDKRGEQAKRLQGAYAGFQPKPAVEVILTVMKPLSEKTFVDQALSNQKGITWLDDCRIPYQDITKEPSYRPNYPQYNHKSKVFKGFSNDDTTLEPDGREKMDDKGRFPANLLVSDDVLNDGKIRKGTGGKWNYKFGYRHYCQNAGYDHITEKAANQQGPIHRANDEGTFSRYFSLDSWTEKTLPFLIVPKASKGEKNKGCEDMEKIDMYQEDRTGNSLDCFSHHPNPVKHGSPRQNHHPTVKPLKLMSYLITMGSRESDIVLDPFCGSGTVLIAARQLARDFVGIEISQEYIEIANSRLKPYLLQTRLSV